MNIQQAASAYSSAASMAQSNASPTPLNAASSTSPSFSDLVSHALSGAVDDGKKAEQVSTLALMGKADINELAIAVSKAELALDTVVTVRDKVISAYQQIMQMAI
jgi:flagellar hook-basal body complex protein FliE